MNLLNWLAENTGPTGWDFEAAAKRKQDQRNLLSQQADARDYLTQSGALNAKQGGYLAQQTPTLDDQMFGGTNLLSGTGPVTRENANTQRAPKLADQMFEGVDPNIDTGQYTLGKAAGWGNLLNSKIAAEAKAKEPYDLAANAKRFVGDTVIAENMLPTKPAEMPETVQTALWMAGGDEKKARGLLEQWKAKEPAKGNEAPAGYRWSQDGSRLEIIPGGPAEVGQKGTPQAYKAQIAGLDTLSKTLDSFSTLYNKTGGEVGYTADAGDLDTKYAQILFGVKQLEQTGALDQGSVDVIKGMLAKPTGMGGVIPQAYIKRQIQGVKDYLSTKRGALQDAYMGTQAPTVVNGGWSIEPVK